MHEHDTNDQRPFRITRTGRVLLGAGLVLEALAVTALVTGWVHAPSDAPASTPLQAAAIAGAPAHVDIPAIGVSAYVDALGLRPSGAVEVPSTYDRVGWYAGSEVPGGPGPTVLLGHIDSHTGPAVFFRLSKLRAGDEVVVARADSAVVRFVVDRIGQFRKSRFPTAEIYGPTATPTLRLLTCAGPFHGHYRDNLVVFAHLQP
jgi:sortase (surface protein transpeptidase)